MSVVNVLPLIVATNLQKLTKCLILLTGGAEGSRTPDLLIANETLYQLSYDPTPNAVKIHNHVGNCKPRFAGVHGLSERNRHRRAGAIGLE